MKKRKLIGDKRGGKREGAGRPEGTKKPPSPTASFSVRIHRSAKAAFFSKTEKPERAKLVEDWIRREFGPIDSVQ